MDELHEECGIIALYRLNSGEAVSRTPSPWPDNVARLAPRMLLDLQHRGQLSAGITVYNPEKREILKTYKEIGTVSEVFHAGNLKKHEEILADHSGIALIGHTRYASGSKNVANNAQPFERSHIKKNKWFSFAFNGQLANYPVLKKAALEHHDLFFAHDSDTEIFMLHLCSALKDESLDFPEICRKMTENLDGSYCTVFLNARGEMFIARDPLGFKPLCFACDGSLFAAASESIALLNLGFDIKSIQYLEPGELLLIDGESVRRMSYAPCRRKARCFFEWVYFASAGSSLDGKSVYLARTKLGEALARQERIPLDKNCIVVPVPDTSKPAASGMAHALGLPCLEGLIRNRHAGRTFIEDGTSRAARVAAKYTILPEVLDGKKVFLVEDSIVRSTTMRILLKWLKNVGGAAEIHVRVACPPIIAPCFYGIDMPTYTELFACNFLKRNRFSDNVHDPSPKVLSDMAKELGADSLDYLSIDAVAKAIGFPAGELCEACINNRYPTPAGEMLARKNWEQNKF